MKKCSNCGNEVKDNAKFCDSCGWQFFTSEESLHTENISSNENDFMREQTILQPLDMDDVSSFTNEKLSMSSKLEKLYFLARNSAENDCIEDAEKYYGMILLEDPMSWEATFYSKYYFVLQLSCEHAEEIVEIMTKAINSTISLLSKTCQKQEEKSITLKICDLSLELTNVMLNNALGIYNERKDGGKTVSFDNAVNYAQMISQIMNLRHTIAITLNSLDHIKSITIYEDSITQLVSANKQIINRVGKTEISDLLNKLGVLFEDELLNVNPNYKRVMGDNLFKVDESEERAIKLRKEDYEDSKKMKKFLFYVGIIIFGGGIGLLSLCIIKFSFFIWGLILAIIGWLMIYLFSKRGEQVCPHCYRKGTSQSLGKYLVTQEDTYIREKRQVRQTRENGYSKNPGDQNVYQMNVDVAAVANVYEIKYKCSACGHIYYEKDVKINKK